MKKKLLLGLVSLLSVLPFGVNAETIGSVEENNTSNANVTVGEVDNVIYNVEIVWNEFKFNWKYNSEKSEYEWQAGNAMEIIPLSIYGEIDEEFFNAEKENICMDSTCTTKISEELTYEELVANIDDYYYNVGEGDISNHFHIGDYSIGGEIVPSVKWTSAEDYEYVEGKFTYSANVEKCELFEDEESFEQYVSEGIKFYSDSACTEELDETVTEYQSGMYTIAMYSERLALNTEEIPANGRQVGNEGSHWYHLSLDLVNKTAPTSTPKSGDRIGTITITIKAK